MNHITSNNVSQTNIEKVTLPKPPIGKFVLLLFAMPFRILWGIILTALFFVVTISTFGIGASWFLQTENCMFKKYVSELWIGVAVLCVIGLIIGLASAGIFLICTILFLIEVAFSGGVVPTFEIPSIFSQIVTIFVLIYALGGYWAYLCYMYYAEKYESDIEKYRVYRENIKKLKKRK